LMLSLIATCLFKTQLAETFLRVGILTLSWEIITMSTYASRSKRFAFDLESNGLLDTINRIHCLVLRDLDSGRVQTFDIRDRDALCRGLRYLQEADEIVGHNIIGYDIPAIQIVHPWFKPKGKVTDTLVLSRLIHADLMGEDAATQRSVEDFPKRLWGSHSLKAWGLRIGNFKDDYDGGWEKFSEEMLSYCVQDVNVTVELYHRLMSANASEKAVDLEHQLAEICFRIGNNGWTFDLGKAATLYAKLAGKRQELTKSLDTLFPPWQVAETFIPARNNKTRGYIKDEPFEKTKMVEFNPSSRRHIEKCLRDKYDWKPRKFTGDGHAMIDDKILSALTEYPEAQKLAEMFMLQKRIGQLAEGRQAWMKRVDSDGRIRHSIVSGGTISGRASHRSPNLAQVPAARLQYGQECRELFTVPDGWLLLGSDLAGLELRCLAHYLNDDDFTAQILDGDIHTYNAKAFGVDRPTAKTVVYAMMYGAGDALVGSVAGGNAKLGKKLKANYAREVPAFATLQKGISRTFKRRGYLRGLDRRKLIIRGGSEHKCLSQLLQSAGAILCKKWVALIDHELKQISDQAYMVGWIHDEVQIACKTQEVADHVGDITRRVAQEAGAAFKTNIPIESDFSVGRTWAHTH